MFIDEKLVKETKRCYPKGSRIVVIRMGADPHPIAPGTKGTVEQVDDLGTVHCHFDNGRLLGLIPDEDEFQMINE